jgi:hypothetical protein
MIDVLALKWLRSGSIRDHPRAETAITPSSDVSDMAASIRQT